MADLLMIQKQEYLKIKGAKIHNLKNINLNIPKYKLVVICGLSGSGKSSLAFDTIYNEGQRRYLEGLSSYARQFLGGLKKPEVDKIENISPTLAINQRTVSSNPRSTVGTITEIYDYLRLLYARVAKPFCPKCGKPITRQTPHQILDQIFSLSSGSEILMLAPVITAKKGHHQGVIEEVYKGGWPEIRVDGIIRLTDEARDLELVKNKKHSLEVVVGHVKLTDFGQRTTAKLSKKEREILKRKQKRLKSLFKDEKIRALDLIKKALQMGKGHLVIQVNKTKKKSKPYDLLFSEHFSCLKCKINLPKIEPRLFSFNSPYGACQRCHGLGKIKEVDSSLVLNPNLSIAEGSIVPFFSVSRFFGRAAGVGWTEKQVKKIVEKAGHTCNEPFGQLPKKVQEKVLYGESGGFEGIINRLERFYYETTSNYVREEMAKYMVEHQCPECLGAKLKPESLALQVAHHNIAQVSALPAKDLIKFFESKANKDLSESDKKIASVIIKEILRRLNFLKEVGLEYITIDRTANTLSVGENQRIRLATHLGSGLSGVIYVLDEPTIGLHQRDINRLIGTLKTLRDLKNTVLVVEHDSQVIDSAEHVIEIGPKAGENGGKITFEGSPKQLRKSKTITGLYLSNKLSAQTDYEKLPVELNSKQSLKEKKLFWLEVLGASQFNLKNINFRFPLERFVCVTGVSGSGKSTLVTEVLAKALLKKIHRQRIIAGQHKEIKGDQLLDKIILIDQSPIGRTPRSNPATYTGVFTPIRQIFTQLQESRIRGYHPGYFSFNVKPGQCAACKGEGFKKIEMYFMPDVYVECETCQGQRFSPEVLQIKYRDKNIAQILNMSVSEAAKFFQAYPAVMNKLKVLQDIGLGYIKLGQPANTLSGGEAQRIKLADELARRSTTHTLYVLDEPTVGLHFDDVKKLLLVLRRLVNKNNSVLIVEHDADVIKEADWIVEMGPEGGDRGGQVIFEGTPLQLKKAATWTGKFI